MLTNSIHPALSPALETHLKTQRHFATELSRKMLGTAQQMSALQLRPAQALFQQWSSAGQQLLCARDIGEDLSLAATRLQPAGEALRQYQQQLGNLAAHANVELNRAAETHLPAASRTAAAFADEVVRKTAEETEKAVQHQHELIEKMHAGGQHDGAGRKHDTGRQSDQAH